MEASNETVAMVAKAAPPIGVAASNLYGISLPDLVQYATLVYLALLIGHKAWRWSKEWKSGKVNDESGE